LKALIVEDEPGLQLGLRDLLEEAGYQVEVLAEGRSAMSQWSSIQPDLIILDLGLPDVDGTQVLEHFHSTAPEIPVLVLTARANESDIVLSFKLGAYDYVTKPFSPRVLLARVEALTRRALSSEDRLSLGDLLLDFERYQATREGETIHLTTREFEILKVLYQSAGKPVSRNDLLDEVWGMASEAGPRTVDTHIALLRKKIEPNPDKPIYIISQRGIGYKLLPDAAGGA